LDEKFAAFDEQWTPKIIAQINDLHLKAVKIQGEFVWHVHDETDEFFLVRSGSMTIQMKGLPDAKLGPNDAFVVPMGVEHRPVAKDECEVLLLEPAGLINTGDAPSGDLTAANDDWIYPSRPYVPLCVAIYQSLLGSADPKSIGTLLVCGFEFRAVLIELLELP
jgi:mannose-6-phosphate isomerase-like protein (cupin superfamily)